MAEKLCDVKGTGGGMSKTVLWTNPSTSSDFTAQTVTLSQSIADYKYIGVENIYAAGESNRMVIMMSVEDFKTKCVNGTFRRQSFSLSILDSVGTLYARTINYSSDTSVTFGACMATGASAIQNSSCIPATIIGYK